MLIHLSFYTTCLPRTGQFLLEVISIKGDGASLDQIILSSSLTDTTSQIQLIPGSARIFSPSFLLIKDKPGVANAFPHLLWLQIRRWLQRPSPFDRRLSTMNNDYFAFLNTDRICTTIYRHTVFFHTDNKRPTTPPAIRFPDLVERNFGECATIISIPE